MKSQNAQGLCKKLEVRAVIDIATQRSAMSHVARSTAAFRSMCTRRPIEHRVSLFIVHSAGLLDAT